MSIRTILVPLDGSEAAKTSLEVAFMIGQELTAHIDVLHVSPDPKDAVPLLGEGMSGAIIEEMIELAERESTDRIITARTMFDDFCSETALPIVEVPPASGTASVSWTQRIGREDEITAKRGRLSDMVVVGRPLPESDVSLSMILSALLFETGRPVLVAPPEKPATLGKKIAVAWNGSSQAARAVSAAMPFLTAASEVTVLTAVASHAPASSADELADYLAWHGIVAKTRTVPLGDPPIGETLLGECEEIGADLLVMGAYSHSRMRQLILGGVTKIVLARASLPILMAH